MLAFATVPAQLRLHEGLEDGVALQRLHLLEGAQAEDIQAAACRDDQDCGLQFEVNDLFVES